MNDTVYCVFLGPKGRFIKSGTSVADALSRAGAGAVLVESYRCPVLAVQRFYVEDGHEYRAAEPQIAGLMGAVGWTCPPGCNHAS